jgi:hypothetical protein
MSSFKCKLALSVALVFAVAASSPVALAQSARDLSVEQNQAYQAGQSKPGSLQIVTLLDRSDATYATGETVRLAIKSNEEAYVSVFNIGPTGKVTQLFPNAFQTDNHVKAGEQVDIPSLASGAQFKVTGPTGGELIKVIATSKPVTLIPDTQFQIGTGIFRTLEGGVDALKRDLEVVSTNPPADVKVAVVNQVIKTIPNRLGAAGALPVAQPGVATPVAGGPASTFPLLVASDRTSYRVGERLTLGVTTTSHPCHLTVVGVEATGEAHVYIPNATLPGNQLAANQTVMVSGGVSPQALTAVRPGAQTITALCTTDPRPASTLGKTAGDVLTPEEKAAFDREIAAASGRPGTFGFAQISVNVAP